MHRIHAMLSEQKVRHHEHHKKLRRISLATFIFFSAFIMAAVVILIMWLSQLAVVDQWLEENWSHPQKQAATQVQPPTRQIAMPISLYPTKSPTSCQEIDESFCEYLFKIQKIVEDKDFNTLIKEQELETITCKKTELEEYLCDEKKKGDVVEGYQHRIVDSDGGGLTPYERMKAMYEARFLIPEPYIYHGHMANERNAIIVFVDKGQKSLCALHLKKVSGKWKINVMVTGYTTSEYLQLSDELLPYFTN